MKGSRRKVAAIFAVVILGALLWLALGSFEPAYQGKTLSAWLTEAHQNGEITDVWTDREIDTPSAHALRAMGSKALPGLLDMVRTRDSHFRQAMVSLSQHCPWLGIHLQPLWMVQTKAVYGFILLGPDAKPAAPKLCALLEDEDWQVRSLAALCLVKIGPESDQAVPALIRFLERAEQKQAGAPQNAHEKYLAAYALGHMGPQARSALPQISALTNDSDFQVRMAAHAALLRLTGNGLATVLEALQQNSDPTNRGGAVLVAGLAGTDAEPAIPFLLRTLQQTNVQLQENIAVALGRIHSQPEVCIPALTALLHSTNDFVRLHALEALRAFGPGAGGLVPTNELIRCLADPSELVRRQATNALRQLAPQAPAKP